MFLIISIISLFLSILIYAAYLKLITHWKTNICNYNSEKQTAEKIINVTLLIPYRNEKQHLPQLVNSIKSQVYPSEHIQVIFINDHSHDGGFEWIEQLHQNTPNIFSLSLQENNAGKKEALSLGILHATGELIIQTDADCIFGEHRVNEFVKAYLQNPNLLLAAPVKMASHKQSFVNMIDRTELMSLQAASAGSALCQKPLMINGANMAYGSDVIKQLNDPFNKKITSGDDQFLLLKFIENKQDIHYLLSDEATVSTFPTETIGRFFKQRIRWSSKTKHYTSSYIRKVAILTFSVSMVLVTYLVLSFIDIKFAVYFVAFFIGKTMIEFPLLKEFAKKTNQKISIRDFVFTQLIYFLYISIVAVAVFCYNPRWKGRSIRK
jgi:cellulose synthase/poly-beta-1,6-N-acetylglucosamine synthase-like glycosyltransferase